MKEKYTTSYETNKDHWG